MSIRSQELEQSVASAAAVSGRQGSESRIEPSPSPTRLLAPRSARARIVVSLIVLLAVVALVAMLGIRQVLLIRVSDQAHDALDQEARELDRLLNEGLDPATGQPFASLEALFDTYLRRNVPSNDEALLTFISGDSYRSSVVRFPLDTLPAERLTDWEDLSGTALREGVSATGTYGTQFGTGYFHATRIRIGEQTGAFVVTIVPAEELEEIQELERYGAVGALAVLALASGGAWLITGRVLAPVRQLTRTARSISRSDLTQRIEVRGSDEAAEMAHSFNSMLDRLEAVFHSQREFVQDASHELRDPLTICSGHLELLSDDPEERRRTVALVIDELERMGRIVDDLQVLADSGQPDFLEPALIDLDLFTHDLAAKAGALARREWVLDSSADGDLVADRYRLTEAVMNLAHNAINHTNEDDVVAVGSEMSDGEVRLWVRDTGTGIAPADRERIFDRFTRGKGAHLRYRGSGLGLAIVKAIAEAHGGRVGLESVLGEGSTFSIVMPRQNGVGQPDA